MTKEELCKEKVKVISSMMSKWPVWRVIGETANEIAFYDRETGKHRGLTREEVVKSLKKQGYNITK